MYSTCTGQIEQIDRQRRRRTPKAAKGYAQAKVFLNLKKKEENTRTYKNMKNKREIIELLIYIIKSKAFNTNN